MKDIEIVKVLEGLLKDNKESTKPTMYVNAYNNALVDVINELSLNGYFADRKDLWD